MRQHVDLLPSEAELREVFNAKYGQADETGPMQRLWRRIGYFSPDDIYEALVAKLVHEQMSWLDVGCGRNVFPGNERLADRLARRCHLLVGVDPDATLLENRQVHRRIQSTIDEVRLDEQFDLITLRMVAEHIADPTAAVSSLARLCRPGGLVVVFTPNQWSPVSLAARIVPHALHHPLKRWLWGSESKDTFPVAYRLNTKSALRRHFLVNGFVERAMVLLDDCRTWHRYWAVHRAELMLWRMASSLGLPHAENCLLAVFERSVAPGFESSRAWHTTAMQSEAGRS